MRPIDEDPRNRRDGLGWVTAAVFGDPRLRLRIETGNHSGGDIRYAVVPSVDRARFLLPLSSRRAAVASTVAYNALRSARVRTRRLLVGGLAALGATRLAGMPVLSVHVPDGIDHEDVLLTEHLAARFGRPLHAAIGIRPPDPHHKPTLQLFDDRGNPQGYAKLGWNAATRAMVRAEAAALRDLPTGGDLPDSPRLLDTLQWGDHTVTIVAPMPRTVRHLRRPDIPRIAAMLAVARRGGPAAPRRPLDSSPFLTNLARRADLAGGAIRTHVTALAHRHGAVEAEFGDWHGDWVPWNLAEHGDRLVAWDWENRGSNVPLGFDLAHQAFQTTLSEQRLPAHAAADSMATALLRYGPALGLGAPQQRMVADAYLIELWLRTAELFSGGGGWNTRLHPDLLHILDARLGSGVEPLRHHIPRPGGQQALAAAPTAATPTAATAR